jgi:hypothetical protein
MIWAGVILALGGSAGAQQLRLPSDLAYAKAEGSPGKVIFSHQSHVAFDKCTACHVSFPDASAHTAGDHAAMEKGVPAPATGQMVSAPGSGRLCPVPRG